MLLFPYIEFKDLNDKFHFLTGCIMQEQLWKTCWHREYSYSGRFDEMHAPVKKCNQPWILTLSYVLCSETRGSSVYTATCGKQCAVFVNLGPSICLKVARFLCFQLNLICTFLNRYLLFSVIQKLRSCNRHQRSMQTAGVTQISTYRWHQFRSPCLQYIDILTHASVRRRQCAHNWSQVLKVIMSKTEYGASYKAIQKAYQYLIELLLSPFRGRRIPVCIVSYAIILWRKLALSVVL